jgi:transcriptional regulator with XRE-family HTH domain
MAEAEDVQPQSAEETTLTRPSGMRSGNSTKRLSAIRKDQQSLARWCGHAPAWLSKVLSGERSVADYDLGPIADFFGVTISELFRDTISGPTEPPAGEQVRERRESLGLTQRQLSERIGYSVESVNRWECGKHSHQESSQQA